MAGGESPLSALATRLGLAAAAAAGGGGSSALQASAPGGGPCSITAAAAAAEGRSLDELMDNFIEEHSQCYEFRDPQVLRGLQDRYVLIFQTLQKELHGMTWPPLSFGCARTLRVLQCLRLLTRDPDLQLLFFEGAPGESRSSGGGAATAGGGNQKRHGAMGGDRTAVGPAQERDHSEGRSDRHRRDRSRERAREAQRASSLLLPPKSAGGRSTLQPPGASHGAKSPSPPPGGSSGSRLGPAAASPRRKRHHSREDAHKNGSHNAAATTGAGVHLPPLETPRTQRRHSDPESPARTPPPPASGSSSSLLETTTSTTALLRLLSELVGEYLADSGGAAADEPGADRPHAADASAGTAMDARLGVAVAGVCIGEIAGMVNRYASTEARRSRLALLGAVRPLARLLGGAAGGLEGSSSGGSGGAPADLLLRCALETLVHFTLHRNRAALGELAALSLEGPGHPGATPLLLLARSPHLTATGPCLLHQVLSLTACGDPLHEVLAAQLLEHLLEVPELRAQLRRIGALPLLLRCLDMGLGGSSPRKLVHALRCCQRLARDHVDFSNPLAVQELRDQEALAIILGLLRQHQWQDPGSAAASGEQPASDVIDACLDTLAQMCLDDECATALRGHPEGVATVAALLLGEPGRPGGSEGGGNTAAVEPQARLSAQCGAARLLRFLFAVERNRKAFKHVFSAEIFGIFIDVGNYIWPLEAYMPFVDALQALPPREAAQLRSSFAKASEVPPPPPAPPPAAMRPAPMTHSRTGAPPPPLSLMGGRAGAAPHFGTGGDIGPMAPAPPGAAAGAPSAIQVVPPGTTPTPIAGVAASGTRRNSSNGCRHAPGHLLPSTNGSGSGSGTSCGRSVGGFELVECVGTGAFGRVHLARRPGVPVDFALKEVPLTSVSSEPAGWTPARQPRAPAHHPGPHGRRPGSRCARNSPEVSVWPEVPAEGAAQEQQVANDLSREVQLLQQLDHPNIVRYYYSFTTGCGHTSTLWIVMEFCGGTSLQRLTASAREKGLARLPEEQTWRIFVQLCLALRYLHVEKHIAHRDLTPSNVLVQAHTLATKVADFGLARQKAAGGGAGGTAGASMMQSVVGTILYSCPEVVQHQPYTHKTDVWALGCLLYKMAALVDPFQGSNPLTVARKIVECDYNRLSLVDHSEILVSTLEKCLTVAPEDRPNIQQVCQHITTPLALYLESLQRVVFQSPQPMPGADWGCAAAGLATGAGVAQEPHDMVPSPSLSALIAEAATATPSSLPAGDNFEDVSPLPQRSSYDERTSAGMASAEEEVLQSALSVTASERSAKSVPTAMSVQTPQSLHSVKTWQSDQSAVSVAAESLHPSQPSSPPPLRRRHDPSAEELLVIHRLAFISQEDPPVGQAVGLPSGGHVGSRGGSATGLAAALEQYRKWLFHDKRSGLVLHREASRLMSRSTEVVDCCDAHGVPAAAWYGGDLWALRGITYEQLHGQLLATCLERGYNTGAGARNSGAKGGGRTEALR